MVMDTPNPVFNNVSGWFFQLFKLYPNSLLGIMSLDIVPCTSGHDCTNIFNHLKSQSGLTFGTG